MSKSEWGNVTWVLFHSLIENIKEETTPKFINEIFMNIKLICNNLPCPHCKDHAMSYLNKYKNYNFDTKQKLKIFIYTFHNIVNKRLNKKLAPLDVLEKYKTTNLNNILNTFKFIYLKKQQSRMLLYSFHRRLAVNKLIIFIINNKQNFNNL
jgi:hypothetical protein